MVRVVTIDDVAGMVKDGARSRRELARQAGVAHTTINRLIIAMHVSTLLDCCVRLASSEADFTPAELDALDYLQKWVNKMKKSEKK